MSEHYAGAYLASFADPSGRGFKAHIEHVPHDMTPLECLTAAVGEVAELELSFFPAWIADRAYDDEYSGPKLHESKRVKVIAQDRRSAAVVRFAPVKED